jgi:mannitol PTS system EIIA component
MDILTRENVCIGASAADKMDAIRQAGEVLVGAGCVARPYVDGMLARERALSTYLGNGIAIPHGENEDLEAVLRPGIAVLQLPSGVAWEPGERAHLVIGLAATRTSQDHLVVLSHLLELLQAPEAIGALVRTDDPMLIVEWLLHGDSQKRGAPGTRHQAKGTAACS